MKKKTTDLHVCRVGARGGHQEINKSFKVAKGTLCSGIVGKVIPQLCPTVTKKLRFNQYGALVELTCLPCLEDYILC